MRTFLLLTALFTFGLAGTTLAHAGGPHGHRGPPPPVGPLMHGLHDLSLDATQQAALDEAMELIKATRPERPTRGERPERADGERPSREEHEAREARRRAEAETFEAQIATATPDTEWLHSTLDDGPRGAAPQVAHDHLDLLLEVHAQLTDGQRKELSAALTERRTRHEAEREAHRGEPRPDSE